MTSLRFLRAGTALVVCLAFAAIHQSDKLRRQHAPAAALAPAASVRPAGIEKMREPAPNPTVVVPAARDEAAGLYTAPPVRRDKLV